MPRLAAELESDLSLLDARDGAQSLGDQLGVRNVTLVDVGEENHLVVDARRRLVGLVKHHGEDSGPLASLDRVVAFRCLIQMV